MHFEEIILDQNRSRGSLTTGGSLLHSNVANARNRDLQKINQFCKPTPNTDARKIFRGSFQETLCPKWDSLRFSCEVERGEGG